MTISALTSPAFLSSYSVLSGSPVQTQQNQLSTTDKVSLSSGNKDPDYTYAALLNKANAAANRQQKATVAEEKPEQGQLNSDVLEKMLQQVLDNKVGLDREKLDEIQQKIDALTAKEGELTAAEQKQLELLQQQKEALIKQAAEKLAGEQN